MIVIEEKHHQETDWKCNKDPLHLKIPKVDEPSAVDGRVEDLCMRKLRYVRLFHLPRKVRKTSPEERR